MDDSDSWRRNRPLVFVEDLTHPLLSDDDHHHLHRSLRVEEGDGISIGDGRGCWRPARFGRRPEPLGATITEPEPAWPVTVGFTPVKGQKPEWIIQKLTELGVDHISVLVTDRSVIRWDAERKARQLGRWPRVIREAAMQSRQLRLPTVDGPFSFADFVASHPEAVAADPAGVTPVEPIRAVMIGPEGGWSDAERQSVPLISLPGGVLRSETACVVAGATVVGLRSAHCESSD